MGKRRAPAPAAAPPTPVPSSTDGGSYRRSDWAPPKRVAPSPEVVASPPAPPPPLELNANSLDVMDGLVVDGHSVRDLLRVCAPLTPDEIARIAPPFLSYPSWPTVFQNYGRLRTMAPDEAQESLLRAAGNLCRWGMRLPEAQLTELEVILARVAREDVDALFPQDPWLSNFVTNVWEFAIGETKLTSYPWRISLPIADICNARCTFCSSWIDGRSLVKIEQIEAFADVIAHSAYIALIGHGEPLAHPQFGEICELIARHMDPRGICYTITNGVYLKKWAPLLDRINIQSVSISLNAATPETHEVVMGLGPQAFDQVIESIREIIANNAARPGRETQVAIGFVVTRQNMHEVSDFIRLGNALGVHSISLRSLMPLPDMIEGLNYHTLPATLHPDFERLREEAIAAIIASKVPVEAEPANWSVEVFPSRIMEGIAQNPPPLMTRDEALGNRDLRRRAAKINADPKTGRRGQPLDPSLFTRVDWRAGGVVVKTRAEAWSYGLVVPIQAPSQWSGPASVSTTVSEVDGVISLGLLDNPSNTWLDRVFVTGPDRTAVKLTYDASHKDVSLVIHNGSDKAVAAGGFISDPELRIGADGDSEVVPGAAVLTRGVVHNELDPLEDGTNPLGREPRYACDAVYYHLFINELYFRLVPCCYMTVVPKFEEIRFDGSQPFLEAWNAPAMQELRRSLRDGPLLGACRRCPEKW